MQEWGIYVGNMGMELHIISWTIKNQGGIIKAKKLVSAELETTNLLNHKDKEGLGCIRQCK